MSLADVQSFEQLEDYLRTFVNWGGDIVPYDSGGVVCLLGAILDNIHRLGMESDFEEMAEYLTTDQIATLRWIVDHLPS